MWISETWNSENMFPIICSCAIMAMWSGSNHGLSLFEGMKAFRMQDDNICLFRPKKHYQRLVQSMARMCMPLMTEELFVKGLEELLRIDESWIPGSEGAALYIRPIVFATEARFGAKIS